MLFTRAIFFCLCAVFILGTALHAHAQDLPPTCEPEYMDVLEERAWMEGKREMELAQHIILKADSVLEYSCFRDRMSDLSNIGARWSNGDAWQSDLHKDPNVGYGDMGTALGALVGAPLDSYLNANFGHKYGGGSYNGNASACNGMYLIWTFLKCHNFDVNNFKTFEQLRNADPRILPSLCNEANRAGKWSDAINAAYPPPAAPALAGGMDKTIHYNEKLSGQCSQATPIPTGVTVSPPGVPPYEEHLCLPPGCSYNGTSCQ